MVESRFLRTYGLRIYRERLLGILRMFCHPLAATILNFKTLLWRQVLGYLVECGPIFAA
jgi:hypothetical protein